MVVLTLKKKRKYDTLLLRIGVDTMKIILSENLQKVIWYVIVPFVIIMLLFSIGVFFYNLKNHDEKPNETNYWINFWMGVLFILFGSILLAVSIGFCVAMIKNMYDYKIVNEQKFFYYLFLFFPLVPLSFLAVSISKFIHNLSLKHIVEEEREEDIYEEGNQY